MKTTRPFFIFCLGWILLNAVSGCRIQDRTTEELRRPNFLFVIADDQSYPHASAYDRQVFQTPAFDSVARAGALLTAAFVAAPQCSPSRAAFLTGKHIWQLEEAGTHSSYFPKKFPVFTDLLESSGYKVGFTGKAWGPGNWKDSGWKRNPVGEEYNTERFESVPYDGLSKVNYAANFKRFLNDRSPDAPFFFWFGAYEPHRVYEYGSGRRALAGEGLEMPAFLPRHDSVVNDMLDYALEISWFDAQLRKMIGILKEAGELENTVIIVTADNGMAFPHAKANLHEYGIHVPMAICGPGIGRGQTIDDLVSFVDLAPTFLEWASAPSLEESSGKSLVDLLSGERPEEFRRAVFAGRERHTHARPDNAGYPARAIRTKKFLYIRNLKPDRWPVGDPAPGVQEKLQDGPDLKEIVHGYEDIDDSPTKRVMLYERERWPLLFEAAYAKRPAEQLYDIQADPGCLNDLSADPNYASALAELRQRLTRQLNDDGDPRLTGSGDVFDTYPRFGSMRLFDGFRERGKYNKAFDKHRAKETTDGLLDQQ